MRLGGFDIALTTDSYAARLFDNAASIRLRFRHRYEVNPDYIETFESRGLVFSGKSPEFPIMHLLELPEDQHPFFLATQAHPELTSRPLRPQPMFVGLVRAAVQYSGVPITGRASRRAGGRTTTRSEDPEAPNASDSVDTATTSA